MSEDRKITCDGPDCGADLTWTGNSIDYRIVLGDERGEHGIPIPHVLAQTVRDICREANAEYMLESGS